MSLTNATRPSHGRTRAVALLIGLVAFFAFTQAARAGDRWMYCSASSDDGTTVYYSEVFSVDIGDVYGQGDPEQYGRLVNGFVDYIRSNNASNAGRGAVCYQSATTKGNTQPMVANVKALSQQSQARNGNRNVETRWSR